MIPPIGRHGKPLGMVAHVAHSPERGWIFNENQPLGFAFSPSSTALSLTFPPFEFALDGFADHVGSFLVYFRIQNSIDPRQSPRRKSGWHLLVIDALASHARDY
jgi:hypothetical protein